MAENFADLQLNTDVASLVAGLGKPRTPTFALPANQFRKVKAADKAGRRGIKNFIRPENAQVVLAHLPEAPGDRTHCLLRGDFVLCDLIPAIIAARGRCPHLRIATLGLSIANADALACLVERGQVGQFTLVVSHYFQQVDKATVYRRVVTRLAGIARLAVTRSHAKVILIPTERGDHFSIEGSANLRLSDNLEQMLIFNDAETAEFHAAWIDQIAA